MKRLSTPSSFHLICTAHRTLPLLTTRSRFQSLHVSSTNHAIPLPTTVTGPPPSPPISAKDVQIIRRQRQAELLEHGQDLRAGQKNSGGKLKRRFWKDVSVLTDSEGTHIIHLDARPVRNPSTKKPLPIPPSKPHLATAIALEWDLLTSAQDTLRSHLLPLTSIASRAHDMIQEESAQNPSPTTKTRDEIVDSLIPYLNTDTILCWAPPTSYSSADHHDTAHKPPPSLRDLQIRVAKPIIDFLTTHVWHTIELVPALNPDSILPVDQPADSQAIIRGWMRSLDPWALAGLERATLAGKSLLVGTRLLVEWADEFRDSREQLRADGMVSGRKRFGIEDAAEACSLEVRWQTGRWGEVEDSHDVEKEDLRRQFGSVVLVVGGAGDEGVAGRGG